FSFQPQVLRPVAAMALMVPESMQLVTDRPDVFRQSGKDNGLSVYMAKHLDPGRPPRFWLSSAGQFETRGTSAEAPAAVSDLKASIPDYFPEASSKQGFFVGTTRTIILCFETPVVIALVIVIAMLRNRGDVSTRKGEEQNAIEAVGVGRSGRA